MEENPVGYRFHPTDEELVNHFLKKKIEGKSSEIEAIGEFNINDYDPYYLLSLSRIQSEDPTGYLFAPVIYTSEKKIWRKRTTVSGSWGPSGEDRVVKDKKGKTIGLMKTLIYHERGASKSKREKKKKKKNPNLKVNKKPEVKVKKKKNPWVIHEYHIQNWSHPNLDSYVLCKIKYKGEEDGGVINPSVGQTSQSLASDSNTVTTVMSTPPGETSQPLASSDPNTVTATINTPPEVKQQLSDDEEENGFSVNDLAIQLNKQEREIINTPHQAEQQLSDEENGSSMKDLVTSMIEQENAVINTPPHIDQQVEEYLKSPLDFPDPNMFNDVQQQQALHCLPEIGDDFFDGFDQSMFEENLDGLFQNDNEEDLSLWDFPDQNMFNDEQQQQAPPCLPEDQSLWDGCGPGMCSSDNNTNLQPQTMNLPQGNDENTDRELILQQDCNDYRPKKPLSGIIVDNDDDDYDAESISVTSYQGSMSLGGDSVGSDSSNTHFSSDIDEEETLSSSIDVLISSADSSISRENTESQLARRIIPSNQEVKEDFVETEKDLFVTEDATKKRLKNPQYVSVMKMIIWLILLVAFIGTIVSVLSTVEI